MKDTLDAKHRTPEERQNQSPGIDSTELFEGLFRRLTQFEGIR